MATMISSRPGTPPDAAKEGDARRPNQAARLADVIIPVFLDTLYSTVETSHQRQPMTIIAPRQACIPLKISVCMQVNMMTMIQKVRAHLER
jgi:hypothetical protein